MQARLLLFQCKLEVNKKTKTLFLKERQEGFSNKENLKKIKFCKRPAQLFYNDLTHRVKT